MVLIRSLLSEILTWEYLSRGNRERNYGMRINITMPPHFTGAPIMLLLYGTVGHRKIQIPMRLIQKRPLHSIFNGPTASWRTHRICGSRIYSWAITCRLDRKSTPSELQSLMRISYAVFCLNKKIKIHNKQTR